MEKLSHGKAPYYCADPQCPGDINRRKLEEYESLKLQMSQVMAFYEQQKTKLEAAEEMAKALKKSVGYLAHMQDALDNALGLSPRINAYAMEMEEALTPWNKAGKGEK